MKKSEFLLTDEQTFNLHLNTPYKMSGDRKELDAYCRGVDEGSKAQLDHIFKMLAERGDVYWRDYDIEIAGLDELYKAFIPFSEAIEE